MTERVVLRSVGGRLTAVKLGRDEAEREALAAEAAALADVSHPGVVRLVGHDAEAGELVTSWAGDRSALEQPAGDLTSALARTAAVAQIVADLHAMGWTHGNLDPSHVVISPDGRPVLCSLARARHGTGDAADDVRAVGEILAHELRAIDRPVLGRLSVGDRALRRSAERAVRSATDPTPAKRPSAAALAATLARLSGGPRPATGSTRQVRRPLEGRATPGSRRSLALMGAAAVATLVAAAVAITRQSGEDASHGAASEAAATTAPPAPSAPSSSSPPTATAPPTPPTTSSTTTAPPAPIHPSPDALVVEIDGARYEIGARGDLVSTGDWDCDGEPTVAVLRPSTGALFVFQTWPSDHGTLTAQEVTRLPGATELRAVRGLDGCDLVEVETPIGPRRLRVGDAP